MIDWIRSNARALALNVTAVVVLAYVLTQGDTDFAVTTAFHPGLESGKWAVRFLLLCLMMSPLSTYFRWTSAIKLRKPAGLWAFGFSVVHVYYYVVEAGLEWLDPAMPLYLTLGLYGLVVFTGLAATSNRWSMQRLGKHWKRLHRLIYYAGLAVTSHAILAAAMSKKMFLYDPEAVPELRVYLALLVVLLSVRVPQVRALLKRTQASRQTRQLRPQMLSAGTRRPPADWAPDLPPEREAAIPTVELWRSPNGSFIWAAGRESDVRLRGTIEAQPEDELEASPTSINSSV
jgi:sulfoxide reductase heme-binding subunit YedZ